ncbi:hypothetical protein ACH4VM_39650 [Streptomyces sp. NPDC020792]|uniref:hypothetical protein n=1 Tax=Streptomyces sp. NPDC020792 TaxID=3365089 RepID=UPI0037A7FD65
MTRKEDADLLLEAADEVAQFVQRHALVVTATQDPARVVGEVQGLQRAVQRYAKLLFETTGWGNPFLPEREDLEAADTGSEEGGRPKNSVELEVVYRLAVRDVRKAVELAHDRARKHGRRSAGVTAGSGAVDLVTALFMEDRWAPGDYDQEAVELLDERWSCTPSA